MLLGRLKFWLVVGLLISNLVVGGLSLYFLHSVSERYEALLDQSMPVLNSLRTLTRELSGVQRIARRAVDPDNEPAWAELLPQMKDASGMARGHASTISAMEPFRDTRHGAAILRISREYDEKVDAFLALARERKLAEANRYNTEVLRACYDNFQLVLDDAADHIQQQGKNLRERYAEDSRLFGSLVLAFASWPVLAAIVAVFVMMMLIVALLVAVFAPGLGWRSKPATPPAN